MKKRIDKTEREVIETKKHKYLRDLEDYKTGNVRSNNRKLANWKKPNQHNRGRTLSYQRKQRRGRSPSQWRHHQTNAYRYRGAEDRGSQRYQYQTSNNHKYYPHREIGGRRNHISNQRPYTTKEDQKQESRVENYHVATSTHKPNLIRQEGRKENNIRSYSRVVASPLRNVQNRNLPQNKNGFRMDRRKPSIDRDHSTSTYNRFQILEHRNTSPISSPFHKSPTKSRCKQLQESRKWDSPGKRRRSWEEGELEDERNYNREKRGRI
ncbi:Hypothetical predicted protein [Pelobates cultripes]|uniref:Uncharacterized protein n=1 Tax=Pelobates cultripes TaxID=61616 RepID=A0AAD1S759_PELCU|nr:Hypothetical predicted protein [Pelobates cultripes]